MKKKIILGIIIISIALIVVLSIINIKNINKPTMTLKSKNYTKQEILNDCNLKNVSYIDNQLIIADGKIYEYSDKKYSSTDNHCNLISKDNQNVKYKHLYSGYFTTDGNDFYYINHDNELIKEKYLPPEIEKALENYKTSEIYKDLYFFVKENTIYYKNNRLDDELKTITMPNNEKILNAVKYEIKNVEYTIITDKALYNFGIAKSDKCYEYQDVECTKTLMKTELTDHVFDDFKDNISYYDGKYLATKDNKIYTIKHSYNT